MTAPKHWPKSKRKFNVSILYGRRRYGRPGSDHTAHAEVILIDTRNANPHPINAFKAWLYEEFAVQSNRYEHEPEYELYVEMAPAAIAALRAIGAADPKNPAVLVSHEYMGMPTVLAAMMDPLCAFKTIFYAHETATAQQIIQTRPGHDTMFYSVLNWAKHNGYYLTELFGTQDNSFKHALITAARYCDNIVGVSHRVAQELAFLGPELSTVDIDVAWNGLSPTAPIDAQQKHASKAKLQDYAQSLLAHPVDHIFSHVCRMTTSKGLWRDLRVLWHLDTVLGQQGRRAVFFLLSTDAPRRSNEKVREMERAWNWPMEHRTIDGDLTPAEAILYDHICHFNAQARNIEVVLINQFGWNRQTCGDRMSDQMSLDDLRIGTDVEFCQSVYEPFGISPLEALPFGALCVMSSVCGNLELLEQTAGDRLPHNVIVADYTQLVDTRLKTRRTPGYRPRTTRLD